MSENIEPSSESLDESESDEDNSIANKPLKTKPISKE